jgi:hypothetical protein
MQCTVIKDIKLGFYKLLKIKTTAINYRGKKKGISQALEL